MRCSVDAFWIHANLAVVEERFASNFIWYVPDRVNGREGMKQFVSAMRNTAYEIHIEDQIAEGDRVVTRSMAGGRHEGEFQGIPTSSEVKITGISIFRIANGKMVEGWINVDRLGLLR